MCYLTTTVDCTLKPVAHCGKFMIGNISQFTLHPMANTNHKFPGTGAMGVPCEVKSTVLG